MHENVVGLSHYCEVLLIINFIILNNFFLLHPKVIVSETWIIGELQSSLIFFPAITWLLFLIWVNQMQQMKLVLLSAPSLQWFPCFPPPPPLPAQKNNMLNSNAICHWWGERKGQLSFFSPYFFPYFSPSSLIFSAVSPSSLIFHLSPW